jgi:death-on-curing protein
METFLILNGLEVDATIDEQEQLMLGLATSRVSRVELVAWLRGHTKSIR